MLSKHMRSNQNVPVRPVRSFFIGPTRSGKTSVSLSYPNPIVISAKHEAGARIADNLSFHVSTLECDAFQSGKGGLALLDVLTWMVAESRNGTFRRADGSPVGTVVLDSLSHWESILMNEIAGPAGKMEKQHWGVLLEQWKAARAMLWALPVHVVMTCLDEVKTTTTGQIIGHASALKGQICALLPAECDTIAYCEQEQDGAFMTYMCRRGWFTGGSRLRGMPNAPYQNFNFGEHIAPHLGV